MSITDTTAPAEQLVTEEIIVEAMGVYDTCRGGSHYDDMKAALRAVAPLIAARARASGCVCKFEDEGYGPIKSACQEHLAWRAEAVAAEREACLQVLYEIADTYKVSALAARHNGDAAAEAANFALQKATLAHAAAIRRGEDAGTFA